MIEAPEAEEPDSGDSDEKEPDPGHLADEEEPDSDDSDYEEQMFEWTKEQWLVRLWGRSQTWTNLSNNTETFVVNKQEKV